MIRLNACILLASFFIVGCLATCDVTYSDLSAGHTRCLTDKGTRIALPPAQRKWVVKKHNAVRRLVEPPAADMQKVVWDDDLAETAAKWAMQCKTSHDTDENRQEPKYPGVSIGQNMAASSSLGHIREAIENSHEMGWYDEKADFAYGSTSLSTVGHYTQMVVATVARIGCGVADCDGVGDWRQVTVCNYISGQTPDDKIKPWTESETTSCSACPNKCRKKLCQCRGKVCLNGGTLNVANCKCTCATAYIGKTCATKSCPPDTANCARWNLAVNTGHCAFTNVQDDCPMSCLCN